MWLHLGTFSELKQLNIGSDNWYSELTSNRRAAVDTLRIRMLRVVEQIVESKEIRSKQRTWVRLLSLGGLVMIWAISLPLILLVGAAIGAVDFAISTLSVAAQRVAGIRKDTTGDETVDTELKYHLDVWNKELVRTGRDPMTLSRFREEFTVSCPINCYRCSNECKCGKVKGGK